MKERPILMTPENAQKCHDGTKTQTRRTNGLDKINEHPDMWMSAGIDGDGGYMFRDGPIPDGWREWISIKCPYGIVGDRLWVREAWAWPGEESYLYKGRPADAWIVEEWKKDPNCCQVKWTPSIHMPRWACRTVVETTEVRAERLQDISEEDAIAEGVNRIAHGRDGYFYSAFRDEPHHDNWVDPVDAYKELWESINGKGSWERNDWVWVIGFRMVVE